MRCYKPFNYPERIVDYSQWKGLRKSILSNPICAIGPIEYWVAITPF